MMTSRQIGLIPVFGLLAAGLAFESLKAQQQPPAPQQPQVQPQAPQVQVPPPKAGQQPQVQVQAQQQQVQPQQAQPQQQQQVQQTNNVQAPPAAEYRVKQLLGTRVSIDGNVAVGTVDDLVFNDNGQVEYLLVVNEGKLVTIPWEATRFNFEQRTANVNITQEKFQQI